ncbi:DUF222 domain-containing protein [Mycobacterium sp. PO2]|uniref:DUF222 domain-containing protein n=1 Tax=Mycobacterium sp. PO2 TaxID=1882220 RepID=UPI001A8E55E2|nr:DUF222 domain-containing protein [Mycobacterium sp. PO2]
MFESVFDVDAVASEAELRAVVERCEHLKSAAAAAQARATALWAAKREAAEKAAGIPAVRRGQGLAGEVALARRDAPVCGARHLGFARALAHEMPHTLAALQAGALSEWRATLIVRESACLSVEHRGELDAELCADLTRLTGWGNKRVAAEAATIAARLDAAAVVGRARKAPADRAVWTRPAPDAMVYVTALLPVAQGVGVYAALKRQADVTCDGRSRGQVMADTLYERITGASAAAPVSVALNLVMADTTLFGADTSPAWVQGYGPIPAAVARHLLADAATAAQTDAQATLRRLYRHPTSGQLVAMESRARFFPPGLARFIDVRDRTCRTPFCDAPIRHHDMDIQAATPDRAGGPTGAVGGGSLNGPCRGGGSGRRRRGCGRCGRARR